MKTIKSLLFSVLMLLVMASFSQCAGTKKIQDKAPVALNQVYCQSWVAGIEGGGSGMNIFIPLKEKFFAMDSVYFRGKVAKLEIMPDSLMLVGRYKSAFNQPKDMVMNKDPKKEFGNEMPEIPKKFPFDLKDDECVISYLEDQKTKYFKVKNIVEKPVLAYPSAPPNKQ